MRARLLGVRSFLILLEAGKKKCSVCGEKGHNKTTCPKVRRGCSCIALIVKLEKQKGDNEEEKKTSEEKSSESSSNEMKKAPLTPTKKRQGEKEEEEKEESRSKSPKKKAKKSVKEAGKKGSQKKDEEQEEEEEEVAFPISSICYGEMTGENDYRDTIHLVQVIEIRGDGEEERLCRLLAFDFGDNASHTMFKVDELHETPGRVLGDQDELDKGMMVHFLFKNRHSGRKKIIDGYYSDAGVWVKGVVVSTDGESVTVLCKDWGSQNKKAKQEVTVDKGSVTLPWK